MADYFTHFSYLFDVGSAANIERALEIRGELTAELNAQEGIDIGFDVEPNPESGEATLWISSDCYGEPQHCHPLRIGLRRSLRSSGPLGICLVAHLLATTT